MQRSPDEVTPVLPRIHPASERWTLWLGPGSQGSLLQEITAAGPLGSNGRVFGKLNDLADLLDGDLGPGRLVLGCQSVPHEDIGILRRFLTRLPGRELVILAESLEQPTSLLVLPETRVFPKTLTEDLLAYLRTKPLKIHQPLHQGSNGSNQQLELSWQVLRERLANRHDLSPLLGRLEEELIGTTQAAAPESQELVNLGSLAEELLAGFSLERDRRMRFLFRPEGELSMRAPRGELELCLRHLFDLIGRCSSPDSVIRVQITSTSGSEVDPDSSVDATVEFPDEPLADLPMGAELEPEMLARHFGPEISASLRILRSTAASLGASLDSLPSRPGRRRVRLRLPRLPHISKPVS